ncbi:dioxygenase [Pelistega indica]|uniref:Dioxygenase n=1 Tax=Pelistega indica TaxID=1414851 RepID=V8G9Q5_9BURK|nr:MULTISPECIES: VOC family protein [Pelistega]ETD72841.1 dioxygenase [Pelistega indica]
MHNQTLITVQDVQLSAEWYKNNLGLAKGHGGSHYEQLIHNGKLILQLHNMDPDENHGILLTPEGTLGNGVLIWISIDNFDEAIKRLRDNHTKLDKEPFFNERARQWEVWLRDPDGYRIVLSGPSEYPITELSES